MSGRAAVAFASGVGVALAVVGGGFVWLGSRPDLGNASIRVGTLHLRLAVAGAVLAAVGIALVAVAVWRQADRPRLPDSFRTLVATGAVVAGLAAVSAAIGHTAIAGTSSESGWRDFLGPLGSLSMPSAFAAVVLGVAATTAGERRAKLLAVALSGAALGAAALGFWLWVLAGVLRTT